MTVLHACNDLAIYSVQITVQYTNNCISVLLFGQYSLQLDDKPSYCCHWYCYKKLTCDSEGHDLLNDQEDLQFSFF